MPETVAQGSENAWVPLPETTRVRRSLQDIGWLNLWLGICLAAVCYPLVAATILAALSIVDLFLPLHWEANLLRELTEGIAFLSVMIVVGAFYAFLSALLVGGPVLLLAWTIVRLLRLALSWPALGAFCGGLTGFLCLFPLGYSQCVRMLNRPAHFLQDAPLYLTITVLGPMLAILCGQVGGAWGGKMVADDRRSWGILHDATRQRFAFSLQQMLGLTIGLSLLMAAEARKLLGDSGRGGL